MLMLNQQQKNVVKKSDNLGGGLHWNGMEMLITLQEYMSTNKICYIL